MKKIICLIIVFILSMSTGCINLGKGDTDLTSEGFNQINKYNEDGAEIILYTGMKSGSDAREIFTNWAQDNGWEKLDDEFEYFGDLTGTLFEKGNEIMHINIVDAGTVSTVMITIVPENISTETTPSETLEPTQTPTPQVNLLEDLSEISTYISQLDLTFGSSTLYYTFHGQTTLDGATVQHLSVSGDEENSTVDIWANSDGSEFYKVIFNEEEVETSDFWQADYYIETLMLFFKDANPENHIWDDYTHTIESRNLGDGNIDVHIYSYDLLGIMMDREIANIGNHYMIIGFWEYEDENSKDGWGVTKLILN